jgi:hypothetical protein
VNRQHNHPSKLLSDPDSANHTAVGTVLERIREAESGQQYTTRPAAYTIAQFCLLHGRLSKATFYNLRKRGLAPKTFVVGRRRYVSVEACEAWRRSMEELTDAQPGGERP